MMGSDGNRPAGAVCCGIAVLSVLFTGDQRFALPFALACVAGLVLFLVIGAADTGNKEANRKEWEQRMKDSEDLVRSCLNEQEKSDQVRYSLTFLQHLFMFSLHQS
jgi:hypothetical protein